jgi:hypothetical protein
MKQIGAVIKSIVPISISFYSTNSQSLLLGGKYLSTYHIISTGNFKHKTVLAQRIAGNR